MKSALSALLVAALLAGCGSGGDDDDTADTRGETAAETPAPPDDDTAVFETRAVGFTFRYPRDLAVETKPRDGLLGQVSVEPRGRLNALKIRETTDRELRPKHYLEEFRRDFARTVGTVEKRTETIGERETGVLVFEDSLKQDGETVEFTSSSYFFSGAGRTWQLECIADEEHREEIDDVCRGALESLEFKPRR